MIEVGAEEQWLAGRAVKRASIYNYVYYNYFKLLFTMIIFYGNI